MSKQRSANRTKAFKLWNDSGRKISLSDIGKSLGVSGAVVRQWKHLDDWESIPEKRGRGGQPGNKNAVGNSGGGAPQGNANAVRHGAYRKFMPQDREFQELLDIAQELEPVDILWQGVEIAYAKLIWSQRIMFVTNQEDMTKEVKKIKEAVGPKMESEETEWEIQFAWDKQETDIRTFSVLNRELRSAIKQYLAVAPENDERRLKLEQMQAQVERIKAQTEKLKPPKEEKSKKLEDLM